MVTGSLRYCGFPICLSSIICPMNMQELGTIESPVALTQGDDHRFVGVKSLYGEVDFSKIQNASVCVIGLGGVGSWCAEALARMGIGTITLVDLDDVCITNINRQIQALTSTIGSSKCTLLAQRIQDVQHG